MPSLEDDVEDVCIIDSLVQEHVDSFCEDRFEPEFDDALTFIDNFITSFDASSSLVQENLEEASLNWVQDVEPLPLDAPQQVPLIFGAPRFGIEAVAGVSKVCIS